MRSPLLFNPDTLLDDIATARAERDRADERLRRLVAYARTEVRPRPYRLSDLAAAAGMSISGVRTCYSLADVIDVHVLIHTHPDQIRQEAGQ